MKLIFDGVAISILILIAMLIICHTANLLMDTKGKRPNKAKGIMKINHYNNTNTNSNSFINLPPNLPTKYNQIYFDKQEGEECKIKREPEVPCKAVPECSTKTGMDLLSDSEIAMMYKYIMERAGFEVANRSLTGRV